MLSWPLLSETSDGRRGSILHALRRAFAGCGSRHRGLENPNLESMSTISARKRRIFCLALVGFYVALTLLFTYPLWTAPDTVLNELADVRLVTWILAWDAHAMVTDPLGLFDANIFYPNDKTLAFSEHFLGTAVLVAPINWAGHPVLAYNVALLSAFVLTGIGTTLWVRHLTKSTLAGLLAGVIWTFAPAKFDQLSHLQMLTGQWIPFAFWTCSLYLESGRSRFALLSSVFVSLQILTCYYYGLFLLPCLAVYALLLLLHLQPVPAVLSSRKIGRDLIAAALILGVLVVPLSMPYLQLNLSQGFVRELEDISRYSAQPKSFLSPGWVVKTAHMRRLYENYGQPEASFFPGILPSSLFLIAILWLLPHAWRGRWPASGPRSGAGPSGSRGAEAGAQESPSQEGSARADPTRASRLQRRKRGILRAAYWLAFAFAIVAGVGHVASLFVAHWWAQHPRAEWVLDLSQTVHPSLWLAVFAGLAVALRPFSGRGRHGMQASRRAIYVVVLAFLALLTYLLAMGPMVRGWNVEVGHGPYWLLYKWLGPYQGLRAVGRVGQLWVLFVAGLVGFAVAAALEQLARVLRKPADWARGRKPSTAGEGAARAHPPLVPWVILAVLLCIIVWEYRVWPLPTQPARVDEEPIDRWLALQEGDFAVLHVPMAPSWEPWRATRYMLGSTLHWKRLVNGYSGFLPPDFRRLDRTDPLTEEFYSLLRADFPIRYLLVHETRFGRDFEQSPGPGLIADTKNLEYVTRVENTLVFRPRRDWDEGIVIRRTYRTEDLRAAAGIRFEARLSPSSIEEEAAIQTRWGKTFLGPHTVTKRWQPLVLDAPAEFEGRPNGTTTIAVGRLLGVGSTTARIFAGLIVEMQNVGGRLALGDEWVESVSPHGYYLFWLTPDGAEVLRSEHFPHTREGARRLQAFIQGIPDGELVAVIAGFETLVRLPLEALRALVSLGANPTVYDVPVRKLSVLGAKNAPRGSALLDYDDLRAAVRVGAPGEQGAIELRNIRLLRDSDSLKR